MYSFYVMQVSFCGLGVFCEVTPSGFWAPLSSFCLVVVRLFLQSGIAHVLVVIVEAICFLCSSVCFFFFFGLFVCFFDQRLWWLQTWDSICSGSFSKIWKGLLGLVTNILDLSLDISSYASVWNMLCLVVWLFDSLMFQVCWNLHVSRR